MQQMSARKKKTKAVLNVTDIYSFMLNRNNREIRIWRRRDTLNSIKAAIKKLTGYEVKYIFSFNLTIGGFIDYGTGDKTYSIEFEKIKDLIN